MDIGRCTDEVKGCGLPIESAHNAKDQQTILPPAVDGEQCNVQSQSDGRGSRKRERSGGDSMECTSSELKYIFFDTNGIVGLSSFQSQRVDERNKHL